MVGHPRLGPMPLPLHPSKMKEDMFSAIPVATQNTHPVVDFLLQGIFNGARRAGRRCALSTAITALSSHVQCVPEVHHLFPTVNLNISVRLDNVPS